MMGNTPDFNRLLSEAEHNISYGAKRAIEMYIPVWSKGHCIELFYKCCNRYCIDKFDVKKCVLLMDKFGMN